MSNRSTIDGESFQKLLASVFAVQQSQIDIPSLSAIFDIERLIAKGELDVDAAIRLIADRTRNVANANGVAIGLLTGDQLVYRAASGSAAEYIGRRVLATLTVSADTKVSGELLRVENAETDGRIEAGVCRQFGAKSLLILLICHDREIAGLLHVLFSEPHVFQDREVLIYRLMAGLVGEAMSHAAQVERREDPAAELPANPGAIERITPEGDNFVNDAGSMPDVANKPAIPQPCGAAPAVNQQLPAPIQPIGPATMIRHKLQRRLAMAAGIAALAMASWIASSILRPNSALRSSTPQRPMALEQEAPSSPAKTVPAKGASKRQTTPVPAEWARSASATRQRVRVGENEVEQIGDDVTVRYFTPAPVPHRARVGENEVANIGEDVTVRHFTRKLAAVPPAEPRVNPTQPAVGSGALRDR